MCKNRSLQIRKFYNYGQLRDIKYEKRKNLFNNEKIISTTVFVQNNLTYKINFYGYENCRIK